MVRVVGVAGAAVLGLAVVLLSVVLGPPRFARDSLLDRVRPLGDPDSVPEPLSRVGDGAASPPTVPEPLLDVPVEVVLAVLVTAVAAALLVRSLLRARRETDPDPDLDPLREPPTGPVVDVAGVREAVRVAGSGLDDASGRDAADVVIGCWVRLEAAGGAAGSGRRPTDTPTDFARRLEVAVPGLDTSALLRLRSVYCRVRYGTQGASAADVGAARGALADLARTLDPVGRSGPRA